MKPSPLLSLCAAALIATPIFAQEKEELRKRAQELEERARQAKEEGRPEVAKDLIEQLRKLKQDAHGGDEEKARDKKLAHVKEQIDELHKAGKHEEAEQLTKRLQEPTAKGDKEGRKENPDAERRDHVMAAIKHLHAAGLHEPAERIEAMLRERDPRTDDGDAAEHHAEAERARALGDEAAANIATLRAQGREQEAQRRQKEAQRREQEGLGRHDAQAPMEQAMRQAQEQMQRSVREMQERTERAMKVTQEQMAKMARTIDELREQLARQRKD
jgi:hypothetical protein